MQRKLMVWRSSLVIVVIVALASAMTLAVPAARVPVLQALGGALVAEEHATQSADVIIIAVDAGSAGVLEAVDLIREGVAERVAVFASRPGKLDAELLRRGIPEEDSEALRIRQLAWLGVREIMPLPRVSGTEEQVQVLPQWCAQYGVRSLVIVTSWYHSRRLQRVLQRSMKDSETSVTIRIVRYADFEPENWWQTREGARTGIVELQKLLWDLARHPFS